MWFEGLRYETTRITDGEAMEANATPTGRQVADHLNGIIADAILGRRTRTALAA